MSLREDADIIVQESIKAVLPDEAVSRALKDRTFPGKVVLVSIGKAGWQMAKAAYDVMGGRIADGIVVTKYDHVKGPIGNFELVEAGHPVPDENSFLGTQKAIDLVSGLTADDTVLFLISGGGSALFEKPLIPPEDLDTLTKELLGSGAAITEMNTIRKRMSAVKGGKFAKLCEPAQVYAIVLSDIIGDPLDMIASGPAYPDSSTCAQAHAIARKYKLTLTDQMKELLDQETPKELTNVETVINGSVRELCEAAAKSAKKLGYEPVMLTDCLDCDAKEVGSFLAAIARSHQNDGKSLAFLAGGETVVYLKKFNDSVKRSGGRNQEIALSAGLGICSCTDTAIFSIGSDGTDGPTDAAGGYVDNTTILPEGMDPADGHLTNDEASLYLYENNEYPALKRTGGLIFTGATGTNVNDVSVILIKR